MPVHHTIEISLGYAQFTDLSAAVSLKTSTPSTGNVGVPDGATRAVIAVEGAGIRWRDDAQAPSSSIGMPVAAGQTFSYIGPPGQLQMIQQSAGAIVNVSYRRTE